MKTIRALRQLALLSALAMVTACSTTGKESRTGLSETELVESGRQALAKERFARASDLFEEAISVYPYGEFAEQSKLDLAYAYYGNGDFEKAIDSVNLFLRTHPNSRFTAYALYIRGLSNYDYGKTGLLEKWFPRDLSQRDTETLIAAAKDFATIVEKFNNTEYAPDAEKRLKYLLDQQVKHEIEVAKLSISRGQYDGAKARLQRVMSARPDNKYAAEIQQLINSMP